MTDRYEGPVTVDADMSRAVVAMIEQILLPREVFNGEEAEIAQNIADHFRAAVAIMEPEWEPDPWDETGLTPEEKEADDG